MKRLLFIALLGLTTVTYAQEEDLCNAVLRDTIFNSEEFRTSYAEKQSFSNWQCAQSFSSHNEAISSGLKVGVVIYGVPLQVGGKYDTSKVNAWKQENCSAAASATNKDTATYRLIKQESPERLAAWSACMEAKSKVGTALTCAMNAAGGTNVFVAKWLRTTGEPARSAPEVRSWNVSGGTCGPSLVKGERVDEGERQVMCQRQADNDLVVMLETNRGSCWKTEEVQQTRETFSGKLVLTGPKTYQADVIEFKPGAELVTNGHDVVFTARKKIVVEGTPTIVSFEPGSKNPNGLHGRSAGPIVLKAPLIEGTRLFVHNHGEDGQPGLRGSPGIQGAAGADGRGGISRNGRCRSPRPGATGGDGSAGGAGGPGGDAGNGGPVTLAIGRGMESGALARVQVVRERLNPLTAQTYQCDGSCPGVPGAKGEGGPGGAGGPGGVGKHKKSNGCSNASGGSAGRAGATGADGTVGNPGKPGGYFSL